MVDLDDGKEGQSPQATRRKENNKTNVKTKLTIWGRRVPDILAGFFFG